MSNIIEVIQNPDGSWTASGGSSITIVRVTCLTRQKAATRLDAALQAIYALNNRIETAKDSLRLENQRITPARFKCLACGDHHEGSGNLPCPKMSPMSAVEPLHPHNDGLDEYRQPVHVGELDPAQRLALARGELSDAEILEAMRPAIYRTDGGYVFDTAKDDVIAAGRALLALARGEK